MVKAIYRLIHLLMGLIVLFLVSSSPVFCEREIMLLCSYFAFYYVSRAYYNIRRSITPSYLFYLFVCFISSNLAAYHFIYNKHIQLLNDKVITIPKIDHYPLYFMIFLIVSILFILFLKVTKKIKLTQTKIYIPLLSIQQLFLLYTIFFICIILYFIIGLSSFILLIPLSTLFFLIILLDKKSRFKKRYWPAYLLLLCIVFLFIPHRYIFLQFVFPIVIFMLLRIPDSKYTHSLFYKVLLFFCLSIFGIFIYGVFSEFYKLNSRFNAELSFDDLYNIFTNFDILSYWVSRQVYRIFTIWIHLGWNMIEYVDTFGFFYGLSYVKFISPFLNIPYISLPEISATLISASYAQPGLLAEGYANFGCVGAVLNIFVVFIIMELIYIYFIRKKTIFRLLLLLSPMTQILLDGGTLNSMIALVLICYTTLFMLRNEKNTINE